MIRQSKARALEAKVSESKKCKSLNRVEHDDYWLYLLVSVIVLLAFG